MTDPERKLSMPLRLGTGLVLAGGLVAAIVFHLQDTTANRVARATDAGGDVASDAEPLDSGLPYDEAGSFDVPHDARGAKPPEDPDNLRNDELISRFNLDDPDNLYHSAITIWEIPSGKMKLLRDFMQRYGLDEEHTKKTIMDGLFEGSLEAYHLARLFAAERLGYSLDFDGYDKAMQAAVTDYIEQVFDITVAGQQILDATPEINRGSFYREFAGDPWLELTDEVDRESMFDTATFELTHGLYRVAVLILDNPTEATSLIYLFLGASEYDTFSEMADEIDGLIYYWQGFPHAQTVTYFAVGGMDLDTVLDTLGRFSQLLRSAEN